MYYYVYPLEDFIIKIKVFTHFEKSVRYFVISVIISQKEKEA